jgi:hypothetical protein
LAGLQAGLVRRFADAALTPAWQDLAMGRPDGEAPER